MQRLHDGYRHLNLLSLNSEKTLFGKGFPEKEVDAWLAFVKERVEYWKAQEKAKKIPTAYEY
jgi:hypothetical protein